METAAWRSWNVRRFCLESLDYASNRPRLLIALVLTALVVYGVRLFNGAVGLDTECTLQTGGIMPGSMQIGRSVLCALQYAWGIGNVNLYVANFVSVLLLVAAAMLWCFWWSILSQGRMRMLPLVAFGVYFLSSGVWQELLYYTFQAPETALMVALLPFVLFLIFRRGGWQGKRELAFTAVLLALMISVYQAVAVYYVGGALASLVAFSFWGQGDHLSTRKEIATELAKIFAVLFAALVLYVVLDHLVMAAFSLEKNPYLLDKAGTHGRGMFHAILKTAGYAMLMIFGNCSLVDPAILRFGNPSGDSIKWFHAYHYGVSSIGYLPILFAYGDLLWKAERDMLIKIIAVLLPFAILVFPLAGGGTISVRVQWTIPLLIGFMMLFVLQESRMRWRSGCVLVLVVICFFQVQHVAGQNYASVRMYEFDQQIAHTVNRDLCNALEGARQEDVRVLFYGAAEPHFSGLFVPAVLSQHPIAGANHAKKTEGTEREAAFLHAMGYEWHPVAEDAPGAELDELRDIAKTMPCYPNAGYVARHGDVMIVKFSESNYVPAK